MNTDTIRRHKAVNNMNSRCSGARYRALKYLGILIVCFLMSALFHTANAARVALNMPSGHVATAEYMPGEPGNAAIILVHGFLQTGNSRTVKRLGEALHSEGYTVLIPSLTLGISNRVQSLPCDSIHLHSMESDATEISFWKSWVESKGHDRLVLIGHSTGSLVVAAYTAMHENHAEFEKNILISLMYFGPNRAAANETAEDVLKAQRMAAEGSKKLESFGLAFCKQYVTTAQAYLSYLSWTPEKVLASVSNAKVPSYMIFGGADARVAASWVEALLKHGADVEIIDGAGHFFDSTHEFDLLEAVESILSTGQ